MGAVVVLWVACRRGRSEHRLDQELDATLARWLPLGSIILLALTRIGGPVRLPGDCGPQVDRAPLRDPLAYGRTQEHPLPAPILGHGEYQVDPAFAEERDWLLARLRPEAVPGPRPEGDPRPQDDAQGSSGRSSG